MIKPTDIVDEWGDTYLGCPNCKEAIYFPLVRNPFHIYDKRPNKCVKCGDTFDWSGYDAGQTLKSAGAYADNSTLREA